MTELLTAAQMRAIEGAAIASGEVTGLELMERAGRGVVEAIFEEWPELKAGSFRAVVLCGPGNNGGDGFVVARVLKEWGWEVEVFLYGDPEKLPPDARVNYERWRAGHGCRPITEAIGTITEMHPRLVVDAVFGTGLTREPDELLKRVFRDVHTCRWGHGIEAEIVSIDVPSGVCSDSGEIIGANAKYEYKIEDGTSFPLEDCVGADLTVTFFRRKIGHFLAEGPEYSGRLRLVSFGSELETLRSNSLHQLAGLPGRPSRFDLFTVRTNTPPGISDISKGNEDHKYTHGHALILSGGAGRGGAARLAARGALRIGAGLVTLGCPPEALTENAARLDAVMLRPIADGDALGRVLEDKRINALCLGPGMGTGEREVALVATALGVRTDAPPPTSPPHEGEGSREAPGTARGDRALSLPLVGREEGRRARRALVLDADALTILAREPDLFAALHDTCILTPHAGEFARLFPDIAEKLAAPATKGPAYSKVDATREAAKRAGCVVLCKGPDTVIADPSGRCSINSAHYDRAAPWLATAGSGDVLAGFITGLLARGFSPMAAAETGAWLHVECARKFGAGLIAEDLPEQLPAVFRDLGL